MVRRQKSLEEEVHELKAMVAEIHAHIVMGAASGPPGDAAMQRAAEAFLDGNPALMERFIALGGKPPKA